MVLDLSSCHYTIDPNQVWQMLSASVRQTDVVGTYKTASVHGVIFTEISVDNGGIGAIRSITYRMIKKLQIFPLKQLQGIQISLYLLPKDWNGGAYADSSDDSSPEGGNPAGVAVEKPKRPNLNSGSATASLDEVSG